MYNKLAAIAFAGLFTFCCCELGRLQMDATVEKTATQECLTLINLLGNRLKECAVGDDMDKELAKKWFVEKYFSNVNCWKYVVIHERDILTEQCPQDIASFSCSDIFAGRQPESCRYHFE